MTAFVGELLENYQCLFQVLKVQTCYFLWRAIYWSTILSHEMSTQVKVRIRIWAYDA